MPRGDGTGPMGYGPLTGRGLGWCAGARGRGRRPGIGRRMWAPRRGAWQQPEQAAMVSETILQLEERIAALEDLLQEKADDDQ